MKQEIKSEVTEFGFNWGTAEVTRLFSDEAKGWVTIGIKTPKGEIQVYVTKTGKIRVHDKSGAEWKPIAQGGASECITF